MEIIITLILDDDSELDCRVLTIFEVQGKDYVALVPITDEECDDVYLYRYYESEDGVPSVEYIEDDDEYEIVDEAFDEWLDSQEYDELVDAEDEE